MNYRIELPSCNSALKISAWTIAPCIMFHKQSWDFCLQHLKNQKWEKLLEKKRLLEKQKNKHLKDHTDIVISYHWFKNYLTYDYVFLCLENHYACTGLLCLLTDLQTMQKLLFSSIPDQLIYFAYSRQNKCAQESGLLDMN